jgi:integrase
LGTISERNGRHTAQIRIMRNKKTVYTESQTFERRKAAEAWLKKRESELDQPGALELALAEDPPLADVIDRYVKESKKAIGKTKTQCLNTLKEYDIARLHCSKIGSGDISMLATQLGQRGIEPQTVGNYLSHLSSVFSVARPLWKYQLDYQAMEDARTALTAIGAVSKSKHRDRRPTLIELSKLMRHFGMKSRGRIPMQAIIAFAIFSTRREDEITRLQWEDLDEGGARILVRDMKHPGEKDGNNVWCDLPPEALAIVCAQPRASDRIFPCSTDALCARFHRATYTLGISLHEQPVEKNLHFHDLRHDGISRLFELGWNIPQVACVSGHRSWTSLKRYTHIRQSGDKYADWPWLSVVTAGIL